MAEQVAVHPAGLIPLPDGIDPAVAAGAFNAGMSAWWAVRYRIVATGRNQSTLDELLELGAHAAIRVPLDRVAEVWHRDQRGRRPVLIP